MNQPLYVHTGGVKSLSDIHAEVADAMSQLAGSAPDAASLETAYGTISAAFTSALGQALPSRNGALQATSTSGKTISDLLQRAAQMYDEGDQQGAEKLRAAAEAVAGPAGAGGAKDENSSGATGPGSTGAAATGGDMAGQMASQVGQQVGQLAQVIAQSVQGLAQGLTQLPQQIMQGAQGAVESATKGGESDAAKVDEAKTGTAEDDQHSDDGKRAEERPGEHESPTRNAGAQPGRTADAGRAPVPPPAPNPAQTRPQ